jgi:Protein of unknown function (DUF2442)
MIIHVKSAQYVQDYILDIDFDTWESRRVDFAPYIAQWKIFAPLQDIAEFKKFYIDTTVMWKSGADVAPDTLYSDGVIVK